MKKLGNKNVIYVMMQGNETFVLSNTQRSRNLCVWMYYF